MRTRYLALCAVALATIGCSDATSPALRLLVGSWRSPATIDATGPVFQTVYRFADDGAFLSEIRDYGLYPGQARDYLSGYIRVAGRYEVSDGVLVLHPKTMVTWDSFYGAGSPPQTSSFPDTAHSQPIPFQIRGDSLVLQMVAAPLDAPVVTLSVFVRDRCSTLSTVRLPDCE